MYAIGWQRRKDSNACLKKYSANLSHFKLNFTPKLVVMLKKIITVMQLITLSHLSHTNILLSPSFCHPVA